MSITTSSATEVATTLTVAGMTCGNCVRHVREALAEIPGVRAEVDLDSATAAIVHPGSMGAQDLIDAVAEAGYDAVVREAGSR